MKIIKKGKLPVEEAKEATCWRCKAVLEYDSTDIKSNLKNEDYIECPTEGCKAFVSI